MSSFEKRQLRKANEYDTTCTMPSYGTVYERMKKPA
jgi:hypothetical protein